VTGCGSCSGRYGLVRQLDEEDVYDKGWIGRTAAEIESEGSSAGTESALEGSTVKYEKRIRNHISKCNVNSGRIAL
jgi:hypothetical protein